MPLFHAEYLRNGARDRSGHALVKSPLAIARAA